MTAALVSGYCRLTAALERIAGSWLVGLLARFVFAAVLIVYFLNSAATKFDGPFALTDGAYVQILPSVMEAYGYDAAAIPFLPYGLIVWLGSYAEVILPVLIVVGLFTRIAAFGMIVFVAVQSVVDIASHHVDAATIGAWFDRIPGAAILDQRALWLFLLVVLVLHGPGKVSLDHLLGTRLAARRAA